MKFKKIIVDLLVIGLWCAFIAVAIASTYALCVSDPEWSLFFTQSITEPVK